MADYSDLLIPALIVAFLLKSNKARDWLKYFFNTVDKWLETGEFEK